MKADLLAVSCQLLNSGRNNWATRSLPSKLAEAYNGPPRMVKKIVLVAALSQKSLLCAR
jgi:hypothetical protein